MTMKQSTQEQTQAKQSAYEKAETALYTEQVVGDKSPVSMEEAFDIVEAGADSVPMVDLNATMFDFGKKLPGRYIFYLTEVSQGEIKGKTTELAYFMDKDRNRYISGAKILVESCKKLTTIPCFIIVDYKGEKTSKQGSYFDMSVKTYIGNIK